MNKKTLKYSFLATLPVMAGYLVLGMGFGILLHDKGYSFWWAILMSLCIYAGSMQYVGVELLFSILCLVIFGADHFLIPAMVCIPSALFMLKNVIIKENQKPENEMKKDRAKGKGGQENDD